MFSALASGLLTGKVSFSLRNQLNFSDIHPDGSTTMEFQRILVSPPTICSKAPWTAFKKRKEFRRSTKSKS